MVTLCDRKKYEGNKCDGVMFEGERIIEKGRENIMDKFLRCDKCGYKKMTMRRTKFSDDLDLYGF